MGIGGSVSVVERDEDVGVPGADETAVGVAQTDAGIGDADVVQDPAQFLFGNGLPDRVFHRIHQTDRFLNPGAGPCPEMEPDLAGIDGGKEVFA
jgi:hypothetical protein